MTNTEIFSGTDVDFVRVLMGQAGRIHRVIEEDEPVIAVGTNKIYTNFSDISDIVGVWSGTDIFHSGTNLCQSGTYNMREGTINTDGVLVPGATYLVTYVHQDGLTDREIQRCINDAKASIWVELFDTSIDFDDVSDEKGLMIKALMLTKASLNAIGIMNMGNIVQSGFNYSVGDLRVETKLWGEGMSTESILLRLEQKAKELMDGLKLFYHKQYLVIVRDRGSPYHMQRAERLLRVGNGEWFTDGYVMSLRYRINVPNSF